jgi:hypothetical protein
MTTRLLPRLARLLPALALVLVATLAQAATITIVNSDGAGEGFNDPTAATPVGGNAGTTVGEQRLLVFQQAASIWGSILPSDVTILVDSSFDPLSCTSTSAVLGSAGANTIHRDFTGAEYTGTWYSQALANKLAGYDLDGSNSDIRARFNVNLGNTGCMDGYSWYYGFDHAEGPTQIDLLAVLLHEMGHGLGFQTFASGTTGALYNGYPDIFCRFLYDQTTALHWNEEADAQRAASAIVPYKLLWDGTAVKVMAPRTLNYGRALLRANAPGSIAGNYDVGTASFGPALTADGVTGSVVLAVDAVSPYNDACTALTNAAAMAGRIAIVDRGVCNFTTKVKACQDAGAIAVIVADNAVGAPPAGLGGTDATITIPAVRVTQADGVTLKAQIASGLDITLMADPSLMAGADTAGRVMMYTPDPYQSGSSVSHFDVSCTPNLLMEPAINADLTSGVDLTRYAFEDIGWLPRTTVPVQLAIVSVEASPYRVLLTWYASGGNAGTVTVYRRTEATEWAVLGETYADGTGQLVYEDRSVMAGARYGYQLGVPEAGGVSMVGETWVDVPAAWTLALAGARPNPAKDLSVAFTLPNASPALLAAYDVTGRRVASKDVGVLGPGSHIVKLGEGRGLGCGVYIVRLTRGDKTLTTQAVVVR